MTDYAALVDQARLIYMERKDQIDALPAAAEKGNAIAKAKMATIDHLKHRLATIGQIGRVLAAVAKADKADPDAVRALIGDPLGGNHADRN